ncbi:ATP-binding cassette domain-containing protein [Candidatus Thiosymbion oneisti]|uniref:ATP-binding cassette domain-containing protein n=1 Tax=Candidatus Thiosymbion oneisti TaxID=589554 RepID=UPI00159F106B|nr:ATP-binding cassette domain-containing protein [Candidatus Thiosymbion oneisti]
MKIGAFCDTLPHGRVLLRAEGLKQAFGGQIILDGLDLELREGEVVLLRGENGSGKTTLLNILTGNLEPDAGAIHYHAHSTPRSYRFPRPWWRELNPFDHFTPEFVAREGVRRTWQEPRLFGAHTLRDNIAVAAPGHPGENPVLALFAPSRSARRETELGHKADAMLARLSLARRQDSSADKISLGQTKRVAIARAVVAGARILFLDEPLAGLDRQGIGDVLELLAFLVRGQGVTLVIVEHLFNQPHLHGLVTTDWLLKDGAIRRTDRKGRGDDSTRPHSLDPSRVSIRRPAWFGLLAGEDMEVVDELLPRGAMLTRIRRPAASKHLSKPVLEIRELVVSRGPRVVIGLDDRGDRVGFNLALYEGDISVLQAPNGWGKTTLLFALAGLQAISQGLVQLRCHPITSLPAWERAKLGMQFVMSDNHSFKGLRVDENIALAGYNNASPGVRALAGRTFSSLSGGEQRKVTLAAGLNSAVRPVVNILDEPFNAFDHSASLDAVKAIKSSRAPGTLLLVPSAV